MAEIDRHIHSIANVGPCPECVEEKDITNSLLAASADLLEAIDEQENPDSIVVTDVVIDYIDTLRAVIAKAGGPRRSSADRA